LADGNIVAGKQRSSGLDGGAATRPGGLGPARSGELDLREGCNGEKIVGLKRSIYSRTDMEVTVTRRVFRAACVLLAAGVAGVALADELDDSLAALKEAQAKKDIAQIKKIHAEATALAKKAIATPAPAAAADKEAWKSHVDYAKNIQLQVDYIVFATAVDSPPQTTVELLAALEQQNPKSKYLDDAYGAYLAALTKSAGAAKALEVAEKALVNKPENLDLLSVLADNAAAKGQADRELALATRMVAAASKNVKPETATAAEWDRKRNVALGRGYWMSGMVTFQRGRYADADRNLRAAVPLIQGNPGLQGPGLYALGIANYQLGKMTMKKDRMLDGAKFCEQSAGISWANASQALHDSIAIKKEAATMR